MSKLTAAPYMLMAIPSSSAILTSRSCYIIANFQCKLLPTSSQRISVPNRKMCDTISLKVGIINKKINGKGEESNIKRVLRKIEIEKFERRITKRGPQEDHFKDQHKFLPTEQKRM